MPESLEAVLFDFGGTLYDLDDSVVRIWEDALIKEGYSFDEVRFINALNKARSFLEDRTARKLVSGQASDLSFNNWRYYYSIILKDLGIRDKRLLYKLSLEVTQSINAVGIKYKIKMC